VDLATVLEARARLAGIAGGDGLLMHTTGLGPGDPRALARRAAEAALILAYAWGGPVTHVDSADRADAAHLVADAAAAGCPALSARLVSDLDRRLPDGPVRDRVLTPMWRAARFAESYGMRATPTGAVLLCAEPGGGERPEPGGGCYDPAAPVLRARPAAGARLAGLLNPLMVDATAVDPRWLPAVCDRLDPAHRPGRLVVRVPAAGITAAAESLDGTGHRVVWLVAADEHTGRTAPGVCLGRADGGDGDWLPARAARVAAAMLS
jgi:hypothetical protein